MICRALWMMIALLGCQPEPKSDPRPLRFSVASKLSVTQAAAAARGAIFQQHAQRPVVVVEHAFKSKTRGTYTLAPRYASLRALVADLDAQSPRYTWELTPAGHVFVYPSTDSFLTTRISGYAAKDTWFCSILEDLAARSDPKGRSGGCMISGRTWAMRDAVMLGGVIDNTIENGKTISVRVSGASVRILDVVDAAIQKIGRFDITGKRFSPNSPPHWHLNFYPVPAR